MTVFPNQPVIHYQQNAQKLLAHGAGTALAGIGLLGLSLSDTLGEELGVLGLVALLEFGKTKELGGTKRTASSLTFSAWRRLSAMR